MKSGTPRFKEWFASSIVVTSHDYFYLGTFEIMLCMCIWILNDIFFDIFIHRPKSVPNSPSIPRAFSNLRSQLSSAWGGSSKKKQQQSGSTAQSLSHEDKKKFPSSLDCSSNSRVLLDY